MCNEGFRFLEMKLIAFERFMISEHLKRSDLIINRYEKKKNSHSFIIVLKMLIGMKNRERPSQPQLQTLTIDLIGRMRRRSSLRPASELTSDILNRYSNDELLASIDQIE